MKMFRKTVVLMAFAALVAVPASAIQLTAIGGGQINFVNPAAPTDFFGFFPVPPTGQEVLDTFGLAGGTPISWHVTWETDALLGFDGEGLTPGAGLVDVALSVGNLSFTMANDTFFPFLPEARFLADGTFAGIDFNTNFGLDAADRGGVPGQFPFDMWVTEDLDGFGNDPFPFDNTGFDLFIGATPVFPASSTGDHLAIGRLDVEQVIPEPGTLLLLGTGLVGLAGYGRRRREG